MLPMNETVAFAKLFIENGVSAEQARQALVRLRRSAELTNAVANTVSGVAGFSKALSSDDATLKRFLRQNNTQDVIEVAIVLELPFAETLLAVSQYPEFSGDTLNPVPFVTGADLIALGLKPGPAFKKILFDAETEQLNGTVTTKEAALEFVKGNL